MAFLNLYLELQTMSVLNTMFENHDDTKELHQLAANNYLNYKQFNIQLL